MTIPILSTRYPGTTIAEGANIFETCRIDPGAEISAEAVLDSAVVICKNVKIIGKVHLAHAVNVRENATLVGPLHIGEGTYIAREAVIGLERADTPDPTPQTRIGEQCRIGVSAEILAGVQVGNHARVRAASRLIGDLPQYGLAGRSPAVLERYTCPNCSGSLRVFKSFREIIDTRCDQCQVVVLRFSKTRFASLFNRVLLPGDAFGETVNTAGDDQRWSDEKELQ